MGEDDLLGFEFVKLLVLDPEVVVSSSEVSFVESGVSAVPSEDFLEVVLEDLRAFGVADVKDSLLVALLVGVLLTVESKLDGRPRD